MYVAPGQGLTTPWGWNLMSTGTSCHFGHLLQVSFPRPKEAPYEIWLQSAQWFQRRRCLKMLTYTHTPTHIWTTEAYLYYKLTNGSKGSGELKNTHSRVMVVELCTLSYDAYGNTCMKFYEHILNGFKVAFHFHYFLALIVLDLLFKNL